MSYALRKDVIFQDGEFRVNYERQGSRPHRRKWHTVDSNIPTSVQPLSHRPCRSTTPFTTTTTTTTTTPHIAAPKASMPPLMESLKPDTPATVRSSQSFQHKDRRKALQDDLLYKTRVSLDEFIEAFLPKLPKGVEVTSNFVTQMNKAKAWRGFLLPSDAGGKEYVVFKRLTHIFDKMVEQARKQWGKSCPKQQWSLLTAPSSTQSTAERPSTIKPDAYFYRKAFLQTTSYSYYDMAFVAEFNKYNGNAEVVDVGPASSIFFVSPIIRFQNITKVLYGMQHMMAVDARRRFIFGITIENTSLRLWHANRSMLISSTPLDIARRYPSIPASLR
jgi:hypothetical protein